MKRYLVASTALKNLAVDSLPYAIKVLLENVLRNFDGKNVTLAQIDALKNWEPGSVQQEIQFTPSRVIMQDFTGVPCIVDLASMREAVLKLGGNPHRINPLKKTQLVIDHSVQIDRAGSNDALQFNMTREFERNAERYEFLKWGSTSFDKFNVVPPGVGIIHQVNIERLADVVSQDADSEILQYFDTCVGTDSHTTMVNGLGVLGWGVGGIEAEAAMLGQSISMLIPEVVGVKITGTSSDEVLATDIVLTLTQMLRELGVVGKFVEFFGESVSHFSVPLRATISNMCPEFGATAAVFAPDERTLEYLQLTGRSAEHVDRIREYCEAQGVFGVPSDDTRYSQVLELDLSKVVPSIAGPKRPQDRINLVDAKMQFIKDLQDTKHGDDASSELKNGDIVIASITSCTNTSNPEVLIAAGLVAKAAREKGLQMPEHVRTSFAPGSRVVSAYLQNSGLQEHLDALGFNVVGYGCATCIGNSGPNSFEISEQVGAHDLAVCAVLSGNRNFEGRINPDVKMNYLASPALVVAYALAGNMQIDLKTEPLGTDKDGNAVYLCDIWPTHAQIDAVAKTAITSTLYEEEYSKVLGGDANWTAIQSSESDIFSWDENSTYIKKAPYFDQMKATPDAISNVADARVLAILGDSVTTDHISPAGAIKQDSPAGRYLREHGVSAQDFNSYGSRRGNHEVMVRGAFANIRLQNKLVDVAGGYTRFQDQVVSIYDAATAYAKTNTPLVIFAGMEYGTGSSRDWAAKGTALLGVKAVIAQSFERIHRSNLVGMGVLPLQFSAGESFDTLKEKYGLQGDELYDIIGLEDLNLDALSTGLLPKTVTVVARRSDEEIAKFEVVVRIDTTTELLYFQNGGILQFVLRNLL